MRLMCAPCALKGGASADARALVTMMIDSKLHEVFSMSSTRCVLLLTSLVALAAGCTSTAATTAASPTPPVETPQASATPPAARAGMLAKFTYRSITSEAESISQKMVYGARMYFTSEQRFSAPDGDAPWHSGEPSGQPVPFEMYVFPGGTSFTMVTHDAIPRGGIKVAPTLDITAPGVAAALERMSISFDEATYFRYTYTTGPDEGLYATATITAEADLDPSTPEVHTLVYELSLDESTYEIVINGPTITHELH